MSTRADPQPAGEHHGTGVWGISSPLGRNCGTKEIPAAAKPCAAREGQGGGVCMLTDATDYRLTLSANEL